MWRWAPKNWCFWAVVLEKTLESPLDCKEIQPVPPKGNLSWVFIGRTDAEAETPIILPPDGCEELTHLKRPWCWERLKMGGEEDNRGWDGWMASPTQWMWVWVSSGSWWWAGKPGVLQSMGSQRVRHDWVIELNWPEVPQSLFTAQRFFSLSFHPPLNSQMNQPMMHPGSKSVKTDRKPAYKRQLYGWFTFPSRLLTSPLTWLLVLVVSSLWFYFPTGLKVTKHLTGKSLHYLLLSGERLYITNSAPR